MKRLKFHAYCSFVDNSLPIQLKTLLNRKGILFCMLVFIVFVGLPIQAQQETTVPPCLHDARRAVNLKKHPELVQRRAALESFTQKWIKNNKEKTRMTAKSSVITIPVVVHVVWHEQLENISEEQIYSQLEVLNTDFRMLNDTSAIPNEFAHLAADIEIEFCLATTDPNGNPTTGITRTFTSLDQVGIAKDNLDNYFIYYDSLGGKSSWDTEHYLNIWVCELANSGNLLGYASAPSTSPFVEDGVVIDYRYFGTTGTAENSFPNELGRTATHEVGHFFNLEHMWGPEDGGCGVDDFVADTPEQSTYYFSCPTYPKTSCGSSDMFMNFMDYVDDRCMYLFTEGQKARMQAALNGPRLKLSQSDRCSSIPPPPALTVKVKAFMQGPYDAANGQMKCKLREANLLPKIQPYFVEPWSYNGAEQVNTLSNIPNDIVDWVLLELRDGSSMNTIIAQKAGFLKDNGQVVSIDGFSDISFDGLAAADYYIVLRHRNHVDIISKEPVSLPNIDVYDFTIRNNVLNGNIQLASLGGGLFGMHSGDFSGNGTVTVNDFNVYLPSASQFNEYLDADANLDRTVTAQDFNLFKNNSSVIGVGAIRY